MKDIYFSLLFCKSISQSLFDTDCKAYLRVQNDKWNYFPKIQHSLQSKYALSLKFSKNKSLPNSWDSK